MATMKVKPWGEEQGAYVLIEEENFDESFHKKFTAAELKKLEDAPAEAAVSPMAISRTRSVRARSALPRRSGPISRQTSSRRSPTLGLP
jgi:hypothetical protein